MPFQGKLEIVQILYALIRKVPNLDLESYRLLPVEITDLDLKLQILPENRISTICFWNGFLKKYLDFQDLLNSSF